MTVDKVKYFVMAITGYTDANVDYAGQTDPESGKNNCIVVLDDGEMSNVFNDVMMARYQAIIRNTSHEIAESVARTIFNTIREMNSLNAYFGCYLTAAMAGTGTSVTFAPDNGSGTTKASAFAVNDYVLIGSEVLKVTSVSSPNVTASRAQLGTTIAAHSDNDPVYNISHTPIPGMRCDSTNAQDGMGLIPLGHDGRGRHEFSVNWEVRFKNS